MTQIPDTQGCAVLLFRTDLRLNDQPALAAALGCGLPVIPLFVRDDAAMTRPHGASSCWWLDKSLNALVKDLHSHGSRLITRRGDTQAELLSICNDFNVKSVFCGHSYDPVTQDHDERLIAALRERRIGVHRLNTTHIAPPGTVLTRSGTPFRVYTPFYKTMRDMGLLDQAPMEPLLPQTWPTPHLWPSSLTIDELGLKPDLTPSGKDWAAGFTRFTPGERGAREALKRFVDEGLRGYSERRDRPDKTGTSLLSPHLRFGEISPLRILVEVRAAVEADRSLRSDADKFISEVVWREFSYGLLRQQPDLHRANFNRKFDAFPWRSDVSALRAWQRGETGYELVDAGMRELWQTGYMHNRVRMIVASFLTKHLLIDWREGEQWFWDCLLDADPANNPASWQWVAGSGADAAPYFRIFNPITSADKFDPAGAYRRTYLSERPHCIHTTNQGDLFGGAKEMESDSTYPQAIVSHSFARQRALDAYASLKDTPFNDNAD